jgi:N-carbamoylputrescine amidase
VRDVTVAAVHMHSALGAIEANLRHIERWAARLADQGVDVVCLPEMSICGYGHSAEVVALSQPIPGPATDAVCAIAAERGVTLLTGLAETYADGQHTISQIVVNPEGLAGVYRKAHLSPREDVVFRPGDKVGIFDVKGWSWGIQLCYDSHFPEWSTLQALAGAEVLFVGFATPRDEPTALSERLLRYLAARAYDNTCYLVACNAVGHDRNGRVFPGTALILGPKGEVLARSQGWQEGYAIWTLSKEHIERIRRTTMGHFLAHRRPELYGDLCKGIPSIPGMPSIPSCTSSQRESSP